MVSLATPAPGAPHEAPAWLRDRQTAARARVDAAELPSWEEEVWRYSPIDELDMARYTPAVNREVSSDGIPAVIESLPAHTAIVILRDGQIVYAEGDYLVGVADAGAVAESVGGEASDLFADMNAAYGFDPVIIKVPAGRDILLPIIVVNLIEADGIAVFPRLIIDAGADSSFTVLDVVRSAEVASFVAPVVEVAVAGAARVNYMHVEELGPDMWQIANQVSDVGQEATFSATCAVFGGGYARTRIDCRLTGRGSTGNLGAIYFGDGEQTLDFRTFQDHIGPDTTSNLMFKGVLDEKSRSIYTGLIRVGEDARGTNAFQTNRNIKLSESAWAESVPNLEIETNEVKCSHASTVGPIDEEQLFYLQSHGVPPEDAERLIVAGFFDEVLEAMPVPYMVTGLRERISQKLGEI